LTVSPPKNCALPWRGGLRVPRILGAELCGGTRDREASGEEPDKISSDVVKSDGVTIKNTVFPNTMGAKRYPSCIRRRFVCREPRPVSVDDGILVVEWPRARFSCSE
jgi:hypothetical protein